MISQFTEDACAMYSPPADWDAMLRAEVEWINAEWRAGQRAKPVACRLLLDPLTKDYEDEQFQDWTR